MGSLTHTAVCQSNGSLLCQPIPLEASNHISDHIMVIMTGFAEQSKVKCHLFRHIISFILCWLAQRHPPGMRIGLIVFHRSVCSLVALHSHRFLIRGFRFVFRRKCPRNPIYCYWFRCCINCNIFSYFSDLRVAYVVAIPRVYLMPGENHFFPKIWVPTKHIQWYLAYPPCWGRTDLWRISGLDFLRLSITLFFWLSLADGRDGR
jgi:hypothetical protein